MRLRIISFLVLLVVSTVVYGGEPQQNKSDDPSKTYLVSYEISQNQIVDYLNNAKKRIQEMINYAKRFYDFSRLLNDIINEYKGEKKIRDLNNLTKNDSITICYKRKGYIKTI